MTDNKVVSFALNSPEEPQQTIYALCALVCMMLAKQERQTFSYTEADVTAAAGSSFTSRMTLNSDGVEALQIELFQQHKGNLQ